MQKNRLVKLSCGLICNPFTDNINNGISWSGCKATERLDLHCNEPGEAIIQLSWRRNAVLQNIVVRWVLTNWVQVFQFLLSERDGWPIHTYQIALLTPQLFESTHRSSPINLASRDVIKEDKLHGDLYSDVQMFLIKKLQRRLRGCVTIDSRWWRDLFFSLDYIKLVSVSINVG